MNRFFFEGHWTVFLGLVLAALVWFGLTIDRSEPLMSHDQHDLIWSD